MEELLEEIELFKIQTGTYAIDISLHFNCINFMNKY